MHHPLRAGIRAILSTALITTFIALPVAARAVVTYSVNSTADSTDGVCSGPGNVVGTGDCTLREAILNANASLGADTIAFDISGSAPYTIDLLSKLPNVTDPVTIDGSTQPGFAGAPLVGLDGQAVPTPSNQADPGDGLELADGSDGSTIRSLVVKNFSQVVNAIQIDAGSDGDTVAGNFMGVDFDGSTPAPNGQALDVQSTNNVIGGIMASDRNILSGNNYEGVTLQGDTNLVEGNYVGLDATGSISVPNARGVAVYSSGNTIGGTTAAARNVIADNSPNVYLVTPGGGNPPPIENNVIEGNFIGTDKTGNAIPSSAPSLRGSGEGDVYMFHASNTMVGGSTPGAGNVLSGIDDGFGEQYDVGFGVFIAYGSTSNTVEGNDIGVGADGTTALPDDYGVKITPDFGGSGESDNVVEHNVIAHNDSNGILVSDATAQRNLFSQNSFFANGALSIDLGGDGPTANDAADADTGANGLQNSPLLNHVEPAGSDTSPSVVGSLDGSPDADFTLEIYRSPSCHTSGFGEGKTFLQSASVHTDAGGHADIQESLPLANPGDVITMTATDAQNDTSEFSNCVAVPNTPIEADLSVSKSDASPNGPDPVTAGNDVGYQIDVSNQGPDDSTGVAITDDLPPEANFVSASGDGWTCDYDSESHTVFCQRDGLHVDQTSSIIVVVKSPATPPPSCPADGDLASCITDSATVDFAGPDDQFDPNSSDNTATQSTEVQPKPANPDDSTGFVPPDGGTVTTGNNPNSNDTTDASVTLPPGAGGVVDIQEQTPPADLCVDGCSGQAVQIDIPDGYTDTGQPPRVILKYDVTVVRPRGGAKIYIKKGSNPAVLTPACTTHGVANPHPCVGSRQRLPNGDLRVTVLLLSGDPLCGKH